MGLYVMLMSPRGRIVTRRKMHGWGQTFIRGSAIVKEAEIGQRVARRVQSFSAMHIQVNMRSDQCLRGPNRARVGVSSVELGALEEASQ